MSQPSQLADSDQPVMPAVNYLNADRGVRSWLLTLDHKRIGIMFLVSVLIAFLLGGVFALVLRLELLTPEPTSWAPTRTTGMFTLHGVVMVLLFMIPAIPAVFGNFCLPIMMGAKDVAFPRLNLLTLYVYWPGATHRAGRLIVGGADTGWTFYAPYSTTTPIDGVPGAVRRLHPRLLVDPDRPQLHRHHPHAARAGHRLDAAAAVRVGDLRHQHHPGAGDAGARADAGARRHRAASAASASSTRRAAATRCCSSTCSGSTRTRPSTS